MASTYVVERSTQIAAPPTQVFAQIVDLHAWEAWSPWAKRDPQMKTTYTGEAGTVGSSYHWVGNRKVGEGRMTIRSIEAPAQVVIDLAFLKPFKSQSVTEFVLTADGDDTRAVWRMTGKHSFMSKVMGIFMSMDKMIGPDFEQGLASLKAVVEAA